MKAVVLAAGTGSRMQPMTRVLNKHLLPVFDRPMIFYPLATLMQAGIRDIAIIVNPADLPLWSALLGDGSGFGCRLSFITQARAMGIAQALLLASDFLDGQPSVLMLGDNLLWGQGWNEALKQALINPQGARLFCRETERPGDFAVLETDAAGRAVGLEEKPLKPRSRLAVCGLYVLDGRASELAARLRPSARGELEITDLLNLYLQVGALHWQPMERELAWWDAGTPASWWQASLAAAKWQEQTGEPLACLEDIAYRSGWIDKAKLLGQA